MASLLGLPPTASSGSINIRRDVQDAFYRYKMPRLQSKIEGKGNGIKTVIPNMVDIAKALSRPPAYITKYFGAELGALSTCDEKTAKYIVNGAHDAEKLQTVLDGFISKFVLCQKCDNPETVLIVSKKDGTIYRSCQACGFKGAVDMTHKLVSYIRANPPPKPAKKSQAKDRAGAVDEMASAGRSGAGKEEQIEGMVVPDDFDDALQNVSVEGDDDWDEEKAAALREDELAELSENVKGQLSLSSPSLKGNNIKKKEGKSKDKAQLEALDAFGDWLSTITDATSNDTIKSELETRKIPSEMGLVAIVQVLFADEDFVKTFKARLPLLQTLVVGETEQRALLGSLERLVGVVNPKLMSKLPVMLQVLYNNDVVDEEVFMAWRDKPSKKYVSKEIATEIRETLIPFFDWLEAEEDEDASDDEEEE